MTFSVSQETTDAQGFGIAGVPFAKRFEQTIITLHRWIGVAACLVMFAWFVSGAVLVYVRFPDMDKDEQLGVLTPVDWSQVRIQPAKALAAMGAVEFPRELHLEMSGREPVYRVADWKGNGHAVSAATGELIIGVSGEEALRIVRQQLSAPEATLKSANVDSDQWTVQSSWNKKRPFHIVELNDARGSQYYVSARTGEIVLDTHRTERLWNWFGAIPHWIYFEVVRHYSREILWRWTVYVLSSAGIVVVVSGIWIGIRRLRLRTRYANGNRTPFVGWMKWHHIAGVVGSLFLVLWVVSGLLTMRPGGLLREREIDKAEYVRYAGATRLDFPFTPAALTTSNVVARRVTLRYVGGKAWVLLEDGISSPRLVNARTAAPASLSLEEVALAAKSLMPDAELLRTSYLEEGDEYWHSGFRKRKTPVIRAQFDDADGSWFHIDPDSGALLGLVNDVGRAHRWFRMGLHNIDLYWLLKRGLLWDVTLFATLIPGFLVVTSALVIGYRRLQRSGLAPIGIPTRLRNRRLPKAAAAKSGLRLDARSESVLVAFASQTGTAELLANKTADSLRRAGLDPSLRQLGELETSDLSTVARAFFIVSTSGDGDAPDRAFPFQRRVMRDRISLDHLEYGVLGLGDRQYRRFSAFAESLSSWLVECGARTLFAPIHAHNRDSAALDAWARGLSTVSGRTDTFTITAEPHVPWRLMDRRHLNPGSAGGPAYHLDLSPPNKAVSWQAGDIAQVVAGHTWKEFAAGRSTLIEREYSIASITQTGRIHLLVRRMVSPDGQPGIASGFLIDELRVGEQIPLRVRRNPSFHGPTDDRPMILIGNGTGLAGLRAHLQRREMLGHRRNWLIFGERNSTIDTFYMDDLRKWIDSQHLLRLDLVYSREQSQRRYVQHVVAEAAKELRMWLDDGAAVYVCGSALSMAPAVTEQFIQILGEESFEALISSRRYCRDVY